MASAVIYATRSVSGNQPTMRRLAEKAAQTFLAGVPVQLNAGYVQEWDGATVAAGIVGVAKETASNLSSSGVAKQYTDGRAVPFEASAVNILRPSFNDGAIAVELANDDNVFFAQVGSTQTPAVTDVGSQFGMTKDSDGHWYVDRTKTTAGVNTVCKVVKLATENDARGVFIVFLESASQLPA